jgi:ubiquinone/menaquinone biosynthesis C-methylase UbiE
MHYHFGIAKDGEDPFEYAVKVMYKFISPKSKILDCGCGWGAPARLLMRDLNCEVEGVTISKQQYNYIKDFKVYLKNLHTFIPNKKYDTALFLESYTHLTEPKKIIKNFSDNIDSILIKDFASPENYMVPDWGMSIRNKKTYYDEIENDGKYTIQYYKEYKNVLYPSVEYWYKRIRQLPRKEIRGQIKQLNNLCKEAIIMKHEEFTINGVFIYATKNK